MTMYELNKKPKALIIEDDKDLLIFMTEYISEMGFEVCSKDTLPTARDMESSYDLIITDYNIGSQTTKGFLKTLSTRSDKPQPIVVITGEYSNESEVSQFPYLFKPFNMDQLSERINGVLKVSGFNFELLKQ